MNTEGRTGRNKPAKATGDSLERMENVQSAFEENPFGMAYVKGVSRMPWAGAASI